MSLRIRSVAIVGFKSFGERVRLEFSPRINAVIGPNGSGKSNVIEGIRWASHTARTRELRARSATELIFHGSSGKAALGLAEVDLELEGIEDRAALQVTRRLYRDGDGDLEVSGKTVRVRDLHEVLRGSGLGPGGLAVVGQGEIGAVIGADPETMLGYLEEAAGLSKATYRRAQTIDRLETARGHLARLEDLAGELRGRVERLDHEASAAREHANLTREAAQLEAALYRHRVATLREEIKRFEGEIAHTEARSLEHGAAIEQINVDLEAARLERETVQAEFARRSGEVERLGGEARALRERASNADAGLAAAVQERRGLESERQTLVELEAPTPPERPSADVDAAQAALAAAHQHLTEAEALEAQWASDLREARARRAVFEGEFAALTAQSARSQAERESLERELNETRTELEGIEAELTQLEPELLERESARDATRVMLDRLEREAAVHGGVIAEAATRIAELRAARTPLGKEAARLEATRQSRTYLSQGPKRALESGVAGVLGPVADLVRVPAALETAIGAALGRRIEHVVVETSRVAQDVIEHLKRVGGRATFLPLDLLKPRARRAAPILNEPGVRGIAADLIESEYPVVVENLLGDTLVVESLEVALNLARKHAQRPRLVTLAGELVEPGGAVTGGRGRDTGGETFAEARRLKEVSAELASLETELEALETQLVTHRAEAAQGREAIARVDARLSENARALEAARDATVGARVRRESLTERLRIAQARMAALAPAGEVNADAPVLPDLEPLEVGLAEAGQRTATARNAERAADTALREARTGIAVYAEQLRTFEAAQARHAQAQDRVRAIEVRLEVLETTEMEARARLESANPEIVRLEAEAASLDLPAVRAQLEALETRRKKLEANLSASTRALSEAREALESARLAKARREANLESLLAEPPAQTDATDPEGSPRSWATRLSQLRIRLEEIGPVNALAAEEFDSESARLRDLEASVTDAQAAAQELETALEDLERDVTAKLRDSIRRVGDSFQVYIKDLLGGEGELETVRDETGQLEGLALVVTPKGKRTRSLHLLSAGERTMAALAFLFALSVAPEPTSAEPRGLPLAVLDEVDAPLDEANIRRFTHFLQLLAAQGTQFVLVTHQKATMEIADALWGVTTDAGGLSRIFSIRQEPVVAAAD